MFAPQDVLPGIVRSANKELKQSKRHDWVTSVARKHFEYLARLPYRSSETSRLLEALQRPRTIQLKTDEPRRERSDRWVCHGSSRRGMQS